MSPAGEGDEPRRLSVGGESRFVDASSSTAWAGDPAVTAGVRPAADDLDEYDGPPPQAGQAPQGHPESAAGPESRVPEVPASELSASESPAPESGSESASELPDAETRAAALAALAAASVAAGEKSPGSTQVLVRNAIPAGSEPAPVDAGTVYIGSRRTERLTMVVSTLLGTLGLLLAVAAAGIDQVKYDQPASCAAYQNAHKGSVAFGCTATAKHVAVFLPAIGIPVLVLVALIAVWVPGWLPKARFRMLGGLFVLLIVCAVALGLAYSALPSSS